MILRDLDKTQILEHQNLSLDDKEVKLKDRRERRNLQMAVTVEDYQTEYKR